MVGSTLREVFGVARVLRLRLRLRFRLRLGLKLGLKLVFGLVIGAEGVAFERGQTGREAFGTAEFGVLGVELLGLGAETSDFGGLPFQ